MAIHANQAVERVLAVNASTVARLEKEIDAAIEREFDGRRVMVNVEGGEVVLNAIREKYEAAGWNAKITHHPATGDQRDWTPAYTTLDLTPKTR